MEQLCRHPSTTSLPTGSSNTFPQKISSFSGTQSWAFSTFYSVQLKLSSGCGTWKIMRISKLEYPSTPVFHLDFLGGAKAVILITKSNKFIQGSCQDSGGEGSASQDHLQRHGEGIHGFRAGTFSAWPELLFSKPHSPGCTLLTLYKSIIAARLLSLSC